MSAYMTAELAKKAIDLASPSIKETLNLVAKRFAGHLRVSSRVDGEWTTLATRDFGDPSVWEGDYKRHATGKETISQRTGLSSREVQLLYPELLEPGDTVYYGSVVSPGGTIVVAFSGVEAYFDEMFAKLVLAAILALIQHTLELQKAAGLETFAAAA